MNSPVLSVDNLNVVFHQDGKTAHIVHDVSFKVHAGRCLGILGESGSGKSMSCKAVLRLLDKNFKSKLYSLDNIDFYKKEVI